MKARGNGNKDLIVELEALRQENSRLSARLKQQEKLYQKILDSMPAIVFLSDKDHKLCGFNKKYVETVKLPRKSLLGKKVYELLPEAANKDEVSRVLKTGKADKNIVRTAESKYFLVDKIPFKNGDMTGGVIHISIDISEFKKAEDELQRYKKYLDKMAQNRLNELTFFNNKLEQETSRRSRIEEELEKCSGSLSVCEEHRDACEKDLADCEKNLGSSRKSLSEARQDLQLHKNELEQITYASSHFLQEPLRAIASYSQLLQKRYKGRLDEDADDFISFVVNSASRMQRLIDDHIAYSKISLREKNYELTDLNKLLDNILLDMDETIKKNKSVVTREKLPAVVGDKDQLYQLFQNIIGNAVKFHSGKRTEVHIKAEKKGNEWVFSIRDNGLGLKAEYFDRIFIMFNRLHSVEDYPGTGIGLTICRRIVNGHGGRIWVESNVGDGSTFFFTLPEVTV